MTTLAGLTLASTIPLAGLGSDITLDSLPQGSDITTNNVTSSKHGLAPKLPADATKYLDGTGVYSVPAGSAGGLPTLFDSTLGSAAASIDTGANGIASGHKVLFVWIIVRSAEVATLSTLVIRNNNDSGANYDYTILQNRNTTVAGVTVNADDKWGAVVTAASDPASFASVIRLTIPGYDQSTFFKTAEMTSASINSGTSGIDVDMRALAWRNTTAISRMAVSISGGSNLAAGSRLLICGAS